MMTPQNSDSPKDGLPGEEAMPEKSFFQKWKEGIASIPPLELTKTAIRGTWITLIGIVIGLGVSVWYYKTMWWLGIVLAGACVNTMVTLIGQYNAKWAYQRINKTMEDLQCGLGEVDDN